MQHAYFCLISRHMTRSCNFTEPEADEVKTKKSELRLTCDLLMKQVYNVKTAANNPDGPDLEVDKSLFCHNHIYFPSLYANGMAVCKLSLHHYPHQQLYLFLWGVEMASHYNSKALRRQTLKSEVRLLLEMSIVNVQNPLIIKSVNIGHTKECLINSLSSYGAIIIIRVKKLCCPDSLILFLLPIATVNQTHHSSALLNLFLCSLLRT